MKIKFLLMMLFVPVALMAQNINYTVKGKLTGLNSPATAQLYCTLPAIHQSAEIKDGQFELTGTLEEPVLVVLTIDRKGKGIKAKIDRISFYLEAGTIELNSANDAIANAKIKGGKVNADYMKLEAALKPIVEKMAAVDKEYALVPADQRKDKVLMKNLDERNDRLKAEKQAVYLKFTKSNPNSFLSLHTLSKYVGLIPEYEVVVPLFERLAPAVRATKSGREYAAQLAGMKATAVGQMAPEFTQNDVDGNPVKLSDYKGKYVFIDFWASWCGPCRAENPNVLKAYNNYHAKGLEVLGVSLDIEMMKKNWLETIKVDKLPWKQVSDLKFPNQVAVLYGVNAIPQNFLVDPNGKIVGKNLAGQELHDRLAEILK